MNARPASSARIDRLLPLAALLALPAACATADHAGQDARIEALEARLAARDSATAVLEDICAERDYASPPVVRAERLGGPPIPPTPRNRSVLDISPEEPVTHRHVRLTCGGVVLSEAHNWFVPARLPPEMNALLAETDTPFGRAIAPLGFTRERMAGAPGPMRGCPKGTVLVQRAVLRLADGNPVATVLECYTAAALRKD